VLRGLRGESSLGGAFLAAFALTAAVAFDLKPATVKAFDRYVQLTEARMAPELAGGAAFLWIDRPSEAEKNAHLARLKRGEVVVAHLETRDGKNEIPVSDGMVHHWMGTVLLPGVKLDRAIAFVQDYARYPEEFGPTIARAKILKQSADHFDVEMRTVAKKVITVVLDADYAVDYRRLSPARMYTKSIATNIREVDSAGTSSEKKTPAEQGSGFLWRLNTYCSFEERAEGTYEQCESISLTRDIPFGLGWLIRPFVTGIPRETLEFTLGHVRTGVTRARRP